MIHHENDETPLEYLCFVVVQASERLLPTKQDDCCDFSHRQNEVLDDEKLLKDEDAYEQEQPLVVVEERKCDEFILPLVELCIQAIVPSSEIILRKLMLILMQEKLS